MFAFYQAKLVTTVHIATKLSFRFWKSFVVVAIFALFLTSGTIHAQEINWTGAVSSDWNTAGNWDPVGVPGPSNFVRIASGTGNPVLSNTSTVVAVQMGDGKSLTVTSSGRLNITGDGGNVSGFDLGDATLTNNGSIYIEALDGGTLTYTELVLFSPNSRVYNSGFIRINSDFRPLDVRFSGAIFTNQSCGVVSLDGGARTFNNGIINNEGYFHVVDELENLDIFNNNGVLKYKSFVGPEPILNNGNNAIIVNDDPTPIFTYGGTFTGTIDGIFTNEAGTISAGTFTAPNNFVPSGLPSGSQTLYAKITPSGGGCTYIVPFTYEMNTPPTFTTHPASNTACAGSGTSFNIVASNATSYQWQVNSGGGFSNLTNGGVYSNVTTTTLNISNVTGLNGNTYRCVATGSGGSTNSNSANLTVTSQPTAANAGPDQTGASTCGLTQVTLSANSPAIGTGGWSVVSGSGGSFGNSSSPTSTFSGFAGNTYTLRWTISNSPCPASTDDVIITFSADPTVSCPASSEVEDTDPAFTLMGASPAGGIYSGPGVSGVTFDPSASGLGPKTIQYTYTNIAGCTNSCTFIITVSSGCTPVTWYLDMDNDGYYVGTGITQCESPGTGYRFENLLGGGDCNDNDSAVNPGASEICNGIDDDCNDAIDDGLAFTTWYADSDGDGFGDPNVSEETCDDAPAGYVGNNEDCDDTDIDINPNTVWYLDSDGDEYSNGTTLIQCDRPTDYYLSSELTATSGDCDDENASVNPGATEICNGIDDDCNDAIDDGLTFTTWYADSDGDGFGDPNVSEETCDGAPAGYVGNNEDCDDTDIDINPNTVWYLDSDGDEYSNGTTLIQCDRPTDYYLSSELTATSGDCDDENASVNPGATEICNGIDDDCNDAIDDGLAFTTWYADSDGDGFGDPNVSEETCDDAPAGYVGNNEDCDDTDIDINPNTVWYLDSDGDEYSNGTTLIQCDRPTDYYLSSELTATSGDCDDENASVNPGATEICNGIDDDCNDVIDDIVDDGGNWSNGSIGTSNGESNFECGTDDEVISISSTGFTRPNSDNQHFLYQNFCGDFTITARVLSMTGGGWGGLQARESMDAGSKKAVIKTQLSNFVRREVRAMTNGMAHSQQLMRPQHTWLRLVRNGNSFQGYTSRDGNNWHFAFIATITMPSCISVGLISESINNATVTEATFDQVIWTGQPGGDITLENPQEQATTVAEIEIYPNPSSGFVNIALPEQYMQKELSVVVVNGLGKVVHTSTLIGNRQERLQLEVPSGMYQVIFYPGNEEPVTKRLLIQE